MIGHFRIGWAILIIGSTQFSGDPQDGAAICRKIQSFVHESHTRKDPRVVEYLKSLTPQEALAGARYACAETWNNPEFQELPAENRSIGAGKAALLCLSYFFHNCESIETGGEMLLKVAADKREHPSLRRGIVAAMTGGTSRRYPAFIGRLGVYAEAHEKEVNALLTKIAMDKQEDVFLRSEAVRSFAVRLREKGLSICISDPNVQEAIEERRKQTDNVTNVSELIRSGEATLTDGTAKALQPIVERMRTNVKLLAGILAEENEPGDLRKQAKRTLEAYRRSPLMQVDDEIDKALGQGDD